MGWTRGGGQGWRIGRQYIIWRGSSRPRGSPRCFHLRHSYLLLLHLPLLPFPPSSLSSISFFIHRTKERCASGQGGQVSGGVSTTCRSGFSWFLHFHPCTSVPLPSPCTVIWRSRCWWLHPAEQSLKSFRTGTLGRIGTKKIAEEQWGKQRGPKGQAAIGNI